MPFKKDKKLSMYKPDMDHGPGMSGGGPHPKNMGYAEKYSASNFSDKAMKMMDQAPAYKPTDDKENTLRPDTKERLALKKTGRELINAYNKEKSESKGMRTKYLIQLEGVIEENKKAIREAAKNV